MVIFGKKKNLKKRDRKPKYEKEDGFLAEIKREEKIKRDFGIEADEADTFKKPDSDKITDEPATLKEEFEELSEEEIEEETEEEIEKTKGDPLKGLFGKAEKEEKEETAQKEAEKEAKKPEVSERITEELTKSYIVEETEKNKRRIYTLNGLPPEVIAVAFARCSRSPEPFDKIARELNEDLSRKFHERWIVGYGHSSIAEHAILSIAIENVSILATKVLEDNRLASYTEKSTRYQIFDKERYYKPMKIMGSKHAQLFTDTCDMLIDVYTEMYPIMLEFIKQKNPNKEEVEEKLYEVRMKSKTLDNIRYLLPVGILTNLGMTVNARQLEHALTKLLSHPLKEMNDIGREIKETALEITPTLVKYVNYSEYLDETPKQLAIHALEKLKITRQDNKERLVLVEYDRDAEDKLITALLYRNSHHSYKQIRDRIKLMKREEKQEILDTAVEKVGKHDAVLREFEHTFYTFDILIDYGAFRDIQRHRICTQTNQEITTSHGFVVPADIADADLEKQFEEAMEKAKNAYDIIVQDCPYEAAYLVPLAFKKRLLMTMNLREICHFIRLRSSKQGHVSYRRLAQQMWELINEKQPLIARYIEVDKSE